MVMIAQNQSLSIPSMLSRSIFSNYSHKSKFLIVALILCSWLLVGCKRADDAQLDSANQAAGKKLKIAVIPKGTTHEFWKAIHSGARKASQDLGVEIIWKGPLREDNREEQIKVIEDFLSRDVNGIVLSPLDDTALRGPVRNAKNSGIPVVIMDSGLKGDDFVSFVATDNYGGGKMAADRIVKILNGKGRVAMLRYLEGSDSTAQRERAFMDEIVKHPGIELVSSNQFAGPTTETSYQAAENLLNRFKNASGEVTLDAVFCVCEPVVFGMLRALEDAGLAGTIKVVGFDATEKLATALANGLIDSLVLQDPVGIGYRSVHTMLEHLQGRTVPRLVDTGATLVTKENMNEARNHELLHPKLDS